MIEKQQIIDAFHFRHACKEFDPEQNIVADDFDFILETARLSPSSFGLEPWKFLVIQNQELRQKLAEFTWGGQKQLPTASHFVIALSKKAHFMKHGSQYIQHMLEDIRQAPADIQTLYQDLIKNFQQNDFHLLDNERALTDWAAKQTYLALANMMTTAAMIGIDSCPIEGFDYDKLQELLQTELKINPEHYSPAYMVAFGYRKEDPKRAKTRQAIDAVVEWV